MDKKLLILEAAKKGDHQKLTLLLTGRLLRRCAVDENGWTPLHHAVKVHSAKCIKLLVEQNFINPEQETNNGETALYMAVKGHSPLSTISLLLKFGKDIVNICNKNMVSPLMEACEVSNLPLIKILIGAGANVNHQMNYLDAPASNCCSPLAYSVHRNNEELSLLLLDFTADVNTDVLDNVSALTYALVNNSSHDLIASMVEKGADCNVMSENGTLLICTLLQFPVIDSVFNMILHETKKVSMLKMLQNGGWSFCWRDNYNTHNCKRVAKVLKLLLSNEKLKTHPAQSSRLVSFLHNYWVIDQEDAQEIIVTYFTHGVLMEGGCRITRSVDVNLKIEFFDYVINFGQNVEFCINDYFQECINHNSTIQICYRGNDIKCFTTFLKYCASVGCWNFLDKYKDMEGDYECWPEILQMLKCGIITKAKFNSLAGKVIRKRKPQNRLIKDAVKDALKESNTVPFQKLSDLCRIQLRENIHGQFNTQSYINYMRNINLPNSIKDFLSYK